ncbi:MAG: DUF2905 domain-containing protein [Bacteroidota bacterium]
MSAQLGKMLVGMGLMVAAIGILLKFSNKIPFLGKLPGDITIRKDNFQFYFPLMTCIVLSILFTVAMWLISFFSKK